MEINQMIKKSELYLVAALAALLPVFFFSKFTNVTDTPKLAFVVSILLLVVFLKAIRNLISNTLSFTASKFDIPVILIALVYIVSTVLETPNKMEAVFLPGTTTVVAFGALAYFIVTQFSKTEKKTLELSLFVGGLLYSIIVLLSASGVFKAIPQLPEFMSLEGFSPVGSILAGIIYLAAVAPFGVFAIVKEKDIVQKVFFGVALAIMSFSTLLGLFNMTKAENKVALPSYSTSWSVAVDSIKENPLLGTGPGNYLSAFNRFKPLSYNSSDVWNLRFTTGRSYVFTLMTETGIAGLAAFSILLFGISKLYKKDRKMTTEAASLGIITVLLLVFPSSTALLILFFILLSLSEIDHHKDSLFNFNGSSSRLPIVISSIPMFTLVAVCGFYLFNILSADLTYRSSLDSLAKGDGKSAYEGLQKAINTNPYVDRYRISYAQVNLALANTLTSKTQLTDEERNTVAQLVQQSIREGKVAISLNPQRSGNWETLGSIYRAVAPIAEGANDYAVQTYSQAIALDPYNPLMRISLGGIFYSAKQYQNAIDIFKLAVTTKPDLANARYNLAVAYKENGNIDQAIDEMTKVLSLVEKDSKDFELAQKTLEELKDKKKAADTTGSSDNLTAPSDNQNEISPKIELPLEATPPQPEATDSASTESEQ